MLLALVTEAPGLHLLSAKLLNLQLRGYEKSSFRPSMVMVAFYAEIFFEVE